MAKVREEIVGKRFLSVSSSCKLKLNKISEGDWRAGVIRACNHRDAKHTGLQILVEYDDVNWERREWVNLYRDKPYQLFLLEHTVVWAPLRLATKRGAPTSSPALSFERLIDEVGLSELNEKPVEHLCDRRIEFYDQSDLSNVQESGWPWPCLKEGEIAVRNWIAEQDGQRILCTTPSVLKGCRVAVYRSVGTTQWYTAFIVGYNESTRELTVTDDTVLESHSEDPSLVQIRLLGEGVVESILRGENVGITPRRSRSSVNNNHQTGVRLIRRDPIPSSRGRKTSLSKASNPSCSPNPVLSPSSPNPPISPCSPLPIHNSKASDARKPGVPEIFDQDSVKCLPTPDKTGEKSVKPVAPRDTYKKVQPPTKPLEEKDQDIEEPSELLSSHSPCTKPVNSPPLCAANPRRDTNTPLSISPRGEASSACGEILKNLNAHRTDQISNSASTNNVVSRNAALKATVDTSEWSAKSPDQAPRTNGHNHPHPLPHHQASTINERNESSFIHDQPLRTNVPSESIFNDKSVVDVKSASKPPSPHLPTSTTHTALPTAIKELRVKSDSSLFPSPVTTDSYRSNELTTITADKYTATFDCNSFCTRSNVPDCLNNNNDRSCKQVSTVTDAALLHTTRDDCGPSAFAIESSVVSVTSVVKSSSDCSASVNEYSGCAPLTTVQCKTSDSVSIVSVCPSAAGGVVVSRSESLTGLTPSLAVAGTVGGRAVTITATSGPAPQGTSRVASPPSVSITAVVRSPGSQRQLQETAGHHQDGVAQLQLLHQQATATSSAPAIPSSRMDQCDGSSDSGVSVTERSVSRSSVLSDDRSSSAEVKPNTPTPNSHSKNATLAIDRKENVKVWRNPAVLSQSELSIRHIHPMQHSMSQHYQGVPSHVPPPAAVGPGVPAHGPTHSSSHPPASGAAVSLGHSMPPGIPYPPHHPPPPPLHLTHSLQPSLSAAAALYPQMNPDIWKQLAHVPPIQPPYPGMLPRHQEEFFMEERARQHTERIQRERRDQEAREKMQKEKMERERAEQRQREKREREERSIRDWGDKDIQLVNQHFEESFRLASQKLGRENLTHIDPAASTFYRQTAPQMSHNQSLLLSQQQHNKLYQAQKGMAWNPNMSGMAHKMDSREHRSQNRPHASQTDLYRKMAEGEKLIHEGIHKAFRTDETHPDSHVKSHNPPPAHSKLSIEKAISVGLSPYPVGYGGKDSKISHPHDRSLYHPHEKASVIVQPDVKYDKVPSHSISPKQRPLERQSPYGSSAGPSPYKAYEASSSPHSRGGTPHMSSSHSSSPHSLEITKARQPTTSPHAVTSHPDRYYGVSKTSSNYPSSMVPGMIPSHLHPSALPSKSKVSSPPLHVYGKPGIASGLPVTKIDTRPSQQQQPVPMANKHTVGASLPPPAHSSNRQQDSRAPLPLTEQRIPMECSPFDARLYPATGSAHSKSVVTTAASYHVSRPPIQTNAIHPAQTQPLDLGRREETGSPARRRQLSPSYPQENKRVRLEMPSQPMLSRVSEPSALYFPAATAITTVENVVAANLHRTPSPMATITKAKPMQPSPKDQVNGSLDSETPNRPTSTSPKQSLPSHLTTSRQETSSPLPKQDGEQCNSTGAGNVYVHKLKKAWMQRHVSASDIPVSFSSSSSSVASPPPAPESPKPSTTTQPKQEVKGARKVSKPSNIANGHAQKSKDADDSSTESDESTSQKKQSKSKRSLKRAKKSSDSNSESDKESDSSESSVQKPERAPKQDNEPRKKRGRKPKQKQKDDDLKPKKLKEDPTTTNPLQKPPVAQLRKSGESFLQDRPCFEVAPKLPKCRECRWTPYQRNKKMPNIFCRFYAFRRLRYTKAGQLAVAGFSHPVDDAYGGDLRLWVPDTNETAPDLNLDRSKFLLTHVGDQFCDLFQQEKDAMALHMGEDNTVAWKRVVQGVREMCDVCETTLFNIHWACSKCGFVVCIDCYNVRKKGTVNAWDTEEGAKERDKYSWLLCASRVPHEQNKLMLTQIIAGNALTQLGKKIHEVRYKWGIPMYCACPEANKYKDKEQDDTKLNGISKELLKSIKTEPNHDLANGKIKTEDNFNGKDGDMSNSPLNFFADVALSSDKRESESSSSDSDTDSDDKDGQTSTLRELLVRPNSKANANKEDTGPSKPKEPSKKKAKLDLLDDVISCVIERGVDKDNKKDLMKVELKHFIRKYNYSRKGREPLPIRIMTKTESRLLYPRVPHSWLCDGKLLRLHDPLHTENVTVFQDQWKRGQPVIVSGVGQNLATDLWHPQSFSRDFGEVKNNLINCLTDNIVPNQPMRKFWDGFENFGKRLKDDKGQPMVLKLKDWPPGDDFAEVLPTRFDDLMKILPMADYTRRNGSLNLAGRLPECFVRPDLGPKMYIAYGSAGYAHKASTNLHLDISDAVNVMCYVSIPKDVDYDQHCKETRKAIEDANCDVLTKQRVREKQELPGALWHIYHARDSDKIRDLLNKVAIEKGRKLEPHHDPIHDQSWYLDTHLRLRLYTEYGVEGYAIVQCMGDAVFIPAGAPHQVRNLHNCIKVAEDFVSPENVAHCFHLTQEFRHLSDTHTNHEDKLQIKNIIYHAMKDAVAVLMAHEQNLQKDVKAKKEESS